MNKLLLRLFVCVLFANLVYSLDNNKHCKCRIRTDSKIIGGTVSRATDFPWMVSLSSKESVKHEFLKKMLPNNFKIKTHSCGGIIVNERWILTAAHCVIDKLGNYSVGYGNNNDLVQIFDAGRIKVKKVVEHPRVGLIEDAAFNGDIALLELETPIEFTDDVLPGCLDTNSDTDYDDVLITGYGITSKRLFNPRTGEFTKGELSRFLKELEYKDVSNQIEKCLKNRSIICSKSINKKESGCFGDSGGPMHKTKNGRTTIIGLTSGSDDELIKDGIEYYCNGPIYYTRVGYYLKWIEETIGGPENHC